MTDYLTRSIDLPRLKTVLANVARTLEYTSEIGVLRHELRKLGRFGPMIGASGAIQEVYDLIARVAPTEATVLVTGESGTGKELVAQTIQGLSRRRRGSFLAINCGAVSPNLIESELFGHERGSFTGAAQRHRGHFERASGGTLFLDEVTEMPMELQVKLLRVLESGQVLRIGGDQPVATDVRVVAATNRSPSQAVAEGRLREDLYYRLNVFPITLPPLRERPGDVTLLAEIPGGAQRCQDEAIRVGALERKLGEWRVTSGAQERGPARTSWPKPRSTRRPCRQIWVRR